MQCYLNDIYTWKKDIPVDVDVFPVKLKFQGELFVQKGLLKKIQWI